ncbi:tetraacyldisaccharide 4'-kinase [Candidatus Aerophobetes bacterium]|uniref:Tetraacyldisaccharide 4'-kinase n=1 Tax=Aerophobetes bacterium TaxID=2030807 RepID=A0A2A4X3I7_UNCAE|nr:MAG: tetraacyldisaccharide 4'-kinase [Candidatus Aerophobetes bacterium]
MLQKSITKVIAGQGGSYGLKSALLCSSWFFQFGVKTKQFFDSTSFQKPSRVDAPVVCIGNIIAGGSGKTPFLQRMLTDLKTISPEHIAVVSRGYKGQYNKAADVLHLNKERDLTAQLCGDESYMLYKNFPSHGFFVSKNRYKGALRAVCRGAKLVFLDDGMQNNTLFQDMRVVVLHAERLFGGEGVQKGFFLPRGPLRDFPSSLKKANFIVVNHACSEEKIERANKALEHYSTCPIIYTQMVKQGFFDESGRVEMAANSRIGVFCGLGSPKSFIDCLKEEGLDIATSWFLQDHEKANVEALDQFALKAKTMGCKFLVCTEKDWVKLIKREGYALPLCFIKSELAIVRGQDAYATLLNSVKTLVKERV